MLYYSSSSSIGCWAGDHKVSPCRMIISKCGNLLFLHCSFIIPKQSLYIGKVWSTWSTRSPFANGWDVQSISSGRLFLWHLEDVAKKFQQAVYYWYIFMVTKLCFKEQLFMHPITAHYKIALILNWSECSINSTIPILTDGIKSFSNKKSFLMVVYPDVTDQGLLHIHILWWYCHSEWRQ